jgi:hypothetical protein
VIERASAAWQVRRLGVAMPLQAFSRLLNRAWFRFAFKWTDPATGESRIRHFDPANIIGHLQISFCKPLGESRKTGLARNTTRGWLREPSSGEPKYPKRANTSVIEPWSDQLRLWLATDTKRSKRLLAHCVCSRGQASSTLPPRPEAHVVWKFAFRADRRALSVRTTNDLNMSESTRTESIQTSILLTRNGGPKRVTLETGYAMNSDTFFKSRGEADLLYLRRGLEPFRALHRYFLIGPDNASALVKLSSSRVSSFADKLTLSRKTFLTIANVDIAIFTRSLNHHKLYAGRPSKVAHILLSHGAQKIAVVSVMCMKLTLDVKTVVFSCEPEPYIGQAQNALREAFQSGIAKAELTDVLFSPFKFSSNRQGADARSFLLSPPHEHIWLGTPFDLDSFDGAGQPVLTVTPAVAWGHWREKPLF